MDKSDLLGQLSRQLKAKAREAIGAAKDCDAEARGGASPKEKSTDSRVAMEYASLARAQKERGERATAELRELDGFRPKALSQRGPVEVGAIVEIEDEDSGEGRTFFLAPVGAGITLLGPDGDGHLSVVTPSSPIGKAVLGRRCGDIFDVTVRGEVREWKITWIE